MYNTENVILTRCIYTENEKSRKLKKYKKRKSTKTKIQKTETGDVSREAEYTLNDQRSRHEPGTTNEVGMNLERPTK